jgi:ABC-type polysaccharide/polyol phosphate transport system ATPase subunit
MGNQIVIKFEKVGKKFKIGQKLLLKEALLDIFKPASTKDFWALKDVNIEVKKGETLGIIGPNGSGKSTILKLIAGVMVPTEGQVVIKGKVAPLIELGSGFHPELTGRENIYLDGSILGLSKKEINRRYKEIVDFAELWEFIDTPIKHYSFGMYMRLGFSVAVNVNPDILLIDEVLAVGDSAFQQKCIDKMNEFKKAGVTIVFISHNLETVKNFCNIALFVKDGQLKYSGDVEDSIEQYTRTLNLHSE